MESKKEVTHNGIVKSVQGGEIVVRIAVQAGCSGCNIKNSCSLSEQTEKELSIECDPSPFHIGQTVEVRLKESLGFHALFLGYILPFLVLLLTMIVTSQITSDEAIIGLASIGSLVPYYFILYLYKSRIKKKFSYFVNPLN